MNDSLKDTIIAMLYNGSYDVDVSEPDIELLNSHPINVVIPILRDIYDNEADVNVMARAFSAIMAIHDFDKVQFLLDILERSPIDRHANACYELGDFQDPRAITKLCSVLLENSNPNLRYIAAVSLANIGDATALPALEYAQAHDTGKDYEEVPISRTAQWALEKFGAESVDCAA